MSIVHFDGTHTIAKKGGSQVAYQGRKKNKTTNTLWLTDRQGMVVSFLPPTCGSHNDVFAIEKQLQCLADQLKESAIPLDGLFLNADSGFDCKAFRKAAEQFGVISNIPRNSRRAKQLKNDDTYFDELMYQERYVIERSNAWMDAHRTFLFRFDTSIESWTAWHYIFCLLQWAKFISKV